MTANTILSRKLDHFYRNTFNDGSQVDVFGREGGLDVVAVVVLLLGCCLVVVLLGRGGGGRQGSCWLRMVGQA